MRRGVEETALVVALRLDDFGRVFRREFRQPARLRLLGLKGASQGEASSQMVTNESWRSCSKGFVAPASKSSERDEGSPTRRADGSRSAEDH
jgi:hypothetical protein